MKKSIGLALLAAVGVGCASLTPQGAAVRVYEADLKSEDAPTPPLPQECKLVGASGPIEQQQQQRQTYDPYRAQRNAAAANGGNVLLVKSYRFLTLKRTECAESQTRDCGADSAQNWYKVSFGYYACDASALATLAELKPKPEGGLFVWTFNKKEPSTPTPASASGSPPAPSSAAAPAPAAPKAGPGGLSAAELESKVLDLKHEGVGTDLIVAYVRANRLAVPLTAEEILAWKRAGIDDAVIRATFPN
jgi:hypothetical protein